MRVLLVGTGVQPIPPAGYGGVERTLAELARALRAEGAEVEVVNEVRRGRSIDEYWFARTLPRQLARRKFDALHAATPVVANRLAMVGRRYVYTTHSRHWFRRDRWTERWGFFLERRAVRRSAAVVALTSTVLDRMRAVLGPRLPARAPVIPIGVDTDRFRPDLSARDGTRALGVGVVAPFKRWELAAQALAGTGATFELVGPTPDPEYAGQLRAIGPHVRLRGEVGDDELARSYARSDLLLHPSSVELLAGVVLQGLSAGLPVVGGPPVAGLLEEGVTGTTLPNDASAETRGRWRATVQGLLADTSRRQAMGAAARASAERRFAWPTVARAHLALYREVFAS